MGTFVAILQLIEILFRWLLAAIKNFHITASVIVIIMLIYRIKTNNYFPLTIVEAFCYLYIVGYINKKRESKEQEEESIVPINIQNNNYINVNAQRYEDDDDA